MFERVIAQTIQRITAETLQERSLIPLADILQDPRIPARIKPFFETEVHWWLYNDHLARAANKRFDYDNPELASLITYLEQVQFRHARFEREEFTSVLDSGVKLTYNYLCRPQTTLKWYIFRGQPVKPLNEVMLRFGAFSDYEYFRTVFIDWVDRKRSERPTFDAISAAEFERVIRRTDDQILLNCTVEELLDIMQPLFEFIGEGDEQRVPVDALVIFFDDKNIKKLVDQLEDYRDRGGTEVGREGFVALLDELLSSADEEPETDFSEVYQNDELDDVVRMHLQGGTRGDADMPGEDGDMAAWESRIDDIAREEESAGKRYSYPDSTTMPEEPGEEYAGEGEDGVPAPRAEQDIRHADARPTDDAGAAEPDLIVGDLDGELEEVEPPSFEPTPTPGAKGTGAGTQADLDFEWPVEETAPLPEFEQLEDVHGSREEEPSVNGLHFAGIEPERPGGAGDAGENRAAGEASYADDAGALLTEMMPAVERDVDEPTPELHPDVAPRMSDVRRFIDASLERKVLKKIFAKNRADYEAALDRLNGAPNWRLASQILDEIFIRYNVDPYSRTAIRFTDSIYGRYLP